MLLFARSACCLWPLLLSTLFCIKQQKKMLVHNFFFFICVVYWLLNSDKLKMWQVSHFLLLLFCYSRNMTLLLTLRAMVIVCVHTFKEEQSLPLNQLACAATAHPGCARCVFLHLFASRIANPFHLSLLFMSWTWRLTTCGGRRCSLKVITMMVIGAE